MQVDREQEQTGLKRSLGKSGDLLICVLLILVIPQLSSFLTEILAPLLRPLDPDGAFLGSTVHHFAQLSLTLAILPVFGLDMGEIGFTVRNWQASLSLLRLFVQYFVLFIVVGHIILFLTSPAPLFGYPLTPGNVAGHLAFKALLSGTAEEPLFRGLVMTVLFRSWRGQASAAGIRISYAGLIATALFVVAHIGVSVIPFRIIWISSIQLVQAGVLGLFYAVAFDRTGSLLTPILAHNFANAFLTSVGMMWATTA